LTVTRELTYRASQGNNRRRALMVPGKRCPCFHPHMESDPHIAAGNRRFHSCAFSRIQPSIVFRTNTTTRLRNIPSISEKVCAQYYFRDSLNETNIMPTGRTPIQLGQSLSDAQRGGYALGVKLVRGAYHDQELARHRERHASDNALPPVWSNKPETDDCYNQVSLYISTLSWCQLSDS
jgi:hypothetical protein